MVIEKLVKASLDHMPKIGYSLNSKQAPRLLQGIIMCPAAVTCSRISDFDLRKPFETRLLGLDLVQKLFKIIIYV